MYLLLDERLIVQVAGEAPLRVWREHRGLTAAELAARVGVTLAPAIRSTK